MIEEGTPVIAIITDEKTAAHTRSNVQEVIARGANVITIVSRSLSNAGDQIVLPDVHPLLTPLVSIVPAQPPHTIRANSADMTSTSLATLQRA